MKRSILWALERAGNLSGDGPATLDRHDGLSYHQLAERVRGLAGGLSGLGVGPGEPVGVLMVNSLRHLELCLAVPGAGAVLTDIDPRLGPEVESCVKDSGMAVLVVDDAHVERALRLRARCPTLIHVVHSGVSDSVPGAVPYEELVGHPSRHGDPDDTTIAASAYRPSPAGLRVVRLSHGDLVRRTVELQSDLGVRPEDRCLHAVPMAEPTGLALTYAATWAGARHGFVPEPGGPATRKTIEAEQITVTSLDASVLTELLVDPQTYGADLSSLRAVLHDPGLSATLQRRSAALLGCQFHPVALHPDPA